MVENCHCPALPGESLPMPELGDAGSWGLYDGGGRKLCLPGPLPGLGTTQRALPVCFIQTSLAGLPPLFPCAPCPLSPFLLLPAWGGGRKGRRMEVGREGGFHPLVSGIKACWTKSKPFFQGVARLPSSLSPAEGRPHTAES